MTPPMAGSFSLSPSDVTNLEFVAVGLIAFLVFLVASRVLAHLLAQQLDHRQVRTDLVVLARRVVYVVVIGLGIFLAFGLALHDGNVTLVGILLATVVAALGVQDLLQDYVSGYYVLLERHIRVGDRISLDGHAGTVSEVKLRVTLLRTETGDLMVVPNSELFTKPVIVYTKESAEAHAAKPEAPKPEPPK
ncbi:MAG TPA: mechanosensitive ion channel domain-containing protein [Candidatus Dormibacteraeota bacterium]|nr:mechanosensitive ion channel domain-containing protein [Candidatus Dormibacteraeota bacterium]